MKQYRTQIFIAISSAALLLVLIIQVKWIIKTANIKEALFNEKVDIILSRTVEALSADKETCKKIGNCMGDGNNHAQTAKLGKFEVHKIDSLLSHYMNIYDIHIDYSFKVIKPTSNNAKNDIGFINYIYPAQPVSNKKNLEELANENGFELNLIFPKKEQYIRAEMSGMFVTSVILILIVLALFWRTILYLIKEKKISELTTDFLNNMTHEFKTPLTNIALAGKMIQKDAGFNHGDKISQYSDIILQENEKLRLQVEQVLTMTALERGEIPLQKMKLNFHELINDSIKSFWMQIENRQGNLKLNLNAERFVVEGDKTQLNIALSNLIDNAIKYSSEKPDLYIETKNLGHNLLVIISDQGIGMEKEYQKKVFEKYFRIPKGDVHNVKGFGLGLTYVKNIIQQHGGTIALESEIGKGVTFTIILPNV